MFYQKPILNNFETLILWALATNRFIFVFFFIIYLKTGFSIWVKETVVCLCRKASSMSVGFYPSWAVSRWFKVTYLKLCLITRAEKIKCNMLCFLSLKSYTILEIFKKYWKISWVNLLENFWTIKLLRIKEIFLIKILKTMSYTI